MKLKRFSYPQETIKPENCTWIRNAEQETLTLAMKLEAGTYVQIEFSKEDSLRAFSEFDWLSDLALLT